MTIRVTHGLMLGFRFTVHRLRHTYATLAYRDGVALEVIGAVLTRSSPSSTTLVYTHLTAEDLRRRAARHVRIARMTASPTRHVIRRPDGATIAYDVTGDGPPVLFLHGLTNRRQGWNPVTDRLADDFTCVRIDFRGHGDSSMACEYGIVALVGDVRAVADKLGIEEPGIVGHSLGATAAAVYAALNPVRAVICVDQALRFGDFASFLQSHEQALRANTTETVLEIDRQLDLGPYKDVASFERRVRAFPSEVILGIWEGALTTPPEQLTALSEALLPQIKVPLLSLHGSPPPNDYEPWLTALVPTAEVEVWDGMGHLLHLVDAPRFVARVTEFLS